MFLIFLTTISNADSQAKFNINGKVTDQSGVLLLSGEVQLLSVTDSALIKYTSIENGIFLFQSINEGTCLVKVSAAGFKNQISKVSLEHDLSLTIKLNDEPYDLKEVQVKSAKKIFSNRMGNLKVEIENTILSKIPDPLTLLTKLPSVQLSPDGEKLNIIGRGEPLIYLDQQRITLNELNSLSTNDIKSIEIINNPSSKYEADGRTVLLITRSKNKIEGFKAVISENAAFKRFFQNRSALNLTYKKNKLELKANVQYNYLNLWESNSNAFKIAAKDIESDYNVLSTGLRKQLIYGGALIYQLNEDDYLSFNVSNRWQNGDFINTANSYIKEPAGLNNVITDNRNDNKRPLFNNSISYNKKMKNWNGQLYLGAQYSNGAQDLNSSIFNNYNSTQFMLIQDRAQGYKTDVWTARADYEQSFNNALKWESGAALSAANSNSFLSMANYAPFNQTESNFKYEEKIYGAYTQFSGKWNSFSYHTGLRLENTRVRGLGQENDLMVKKDYTNFFTKAGIEWTIAENKSLGLNYAKSIDRPNYASASQITTYINPFFEWANNINIDPAIKDEVAAILQIGQSTVSISYSRLKNPVYYAIEYNDALNRLRMVNTNYELETGINATLTVPFKYKILTSTNSLAGIINKVKDPSAVLNKSKPYLYFYSNNQFALPYNYAFMVSGWGFTKRIEGIFERNAMYAVDFSLSKTFIKNLSCTLTYNSLFSAKEAKENFTINVISSKGIYYQDVREFSIGIKYTFGKIKDSQYKSKGIDDNINRL